MTRIKLLHRYATAEGNWADGSTLDLPDAVAAALVDGGYALRVDVPKPPTPTKAKVETATLPTAEKRETATGPTPEKKVSK